MTVFAVLFAACFLACLYAVMRLLPLYGGWYRANHFDQRPVGFLSGPVLLQIDIRYDNEPPRDISLIDLDTGKQIYGLKPVTDPAPDPGHLILSGDFGEQIAPGEYALRLRPGDNRRLSCSVNILPSQKYIKLLTTPYRSADGSLWLAIETEFQNTSIQSGPIVSIRSEDPDEPGKFTMLGEFRPGETAYARYLDLSELARALDLDLSGQACFYIRSSAEYAAPDDSGTAHASTERRVVLADWPEYDPAVRFPFDPGDTGHLIETCQARQH